MKKGYKNVNINSFSINTDKSFKLVCHLIGFEDSFAIYNRILKDNLDKHVPVK